MVVQRTLTPPVGVRSSHPQPFRSRSTLLRFFITGCSAVGSALGSGPRGRGFKSRHSDHKPVTKKCHRLISLSYRRKMEISMTCFQVCVLQGCPTVSRRLGFFVAAFPAQYCPHCGENRRVFRKIFPQTQKSQLSVFHTDSRDFCVFRRKSESIQFVFKFTVLYLL